MNFQQRVSALVQLGNFLEEAAAAAGEADQVFAMAYTHNKWFTADNVQKAFRAWAAQLHMHKITHWLRPYTISDEEQNITVAIIMAGNIPLVGLHDLLSVLVVGYKAIVKLSDDDKVLMKLVIDKLNELGFAGRISISEQQIPKDFDKVIATGSNNTNRYFEYYFRDKPHLLRANRSSVAVLTGNETPEDMQRLGEDIFGYFGLGCRNVSKLYVPEGYDLTSFFEGIESNNDLINHNKYANNYTYHKAIFLMNLTKHFDNGFLLVKEDERIASPLAVVFYEMYKDNASLAETLEARKKEIQCVVSKQSHEGWIPLGKAQHPELWDYADAEDTIKFLLESAG